MAECSFTGSEGPISGHSLSEAFNEQDMWINVI